MDIRKVKKLIELLEESGIAEIEIKEGEESVRISRSSAGGPAALAPVAAPAPIAAFGGTPSPLPETKEPAAQSSAKEAIDGHVIESPMVGTYYEAPAPGAPAFVQVGQHVKAGDTLCIIEAMKILNQIEADVSGEVKAVFCENGEPVEYGQKLFIID